MRDRVANEKNLAVFWLQCMETSSGAAEEPQRGEEREREEGERQGIGVEQREDERKRIVRISAGAIGRKQKDSGDIQEAEVAGGRTR